MRDRINSLREVAKCTRDLLAKLEQRLERIHAKQRFGIETDHEAQVFGQGLTFLSHRELVFGPFGDPKTRSSWPASTDGEEGMQSALC